MERYRKQCRRRQQGVKTSGKRRRYAKCKAASRSQSPPYNKVKHIYGRVKNKFQYSNSRLIDFDIGIESTIDSSMVIIASQGFPFRCPLAITLGPSARKAKSTRAGASMVPDKNPTRALQKASNSASACFDSGRDAKKRGRRKSRRKSFL